MKKLLSVSATSLSVDIISSPFINVILLLLKYLSENSGFTVFQNFLLSVIKLISRLL